MVARSTKDASDGFMRHARPQRQSGARIRGSQRHGVPRWAMLPLGCQSEAHGDPHAVVREAEEEYCQAVVPVQVVFARVSREEQQSGSTLVREKPMPVGSGLLFVQLFYI